MKFLAIEHAGPEASTECTRTLLEDEAEVLWQLYCRGVVRECYFTPQHDAVLVLECVDEAAARDALASLPLVRERRIEFDVIGLTPYTGFQRLFRPSQPIAPNATSV